MTITRENKAAVPLVHAFLSAETATVATAFCWEYNASGTHAPNKQHDQAAELTERPSALM